MNLCEEHQLYLNDRPAWNRLEAPRRVKSLGNYAQTDQSEFDRLWKQTPPDLRAEILRLAEPELKKQLWAATDAVGRQVLRKIAEKAA